MKWSIGGRALILTLIVLAEFALLEAGLRVHDALEGSRTFQTLFMDDPLVGIRLRPGTRVRYTTVEFSTEIAINAQGVRDDEPIGPKAENERRVVVLGDSLVLSVQVANEETFCERLERRLNSHGGPLVWRVINAGVQGYGPVQEWLFFDRIAASFQPDIVLIIPFVGNDAIEAADTRAELDAGRPLADSQPTARGLRRLVRSSLTLQSVRLRWDQLRGRITVGTPERPLATYLADPPAVVQQGLDVSRRAFGQIVGRARAIGARSAFALMPARFQVNDEDFSNLDAALRQTGGKLDRNAASLRFAQTLGPLGVPMIDLQPVLFAQPNRAGTFFERTVHLTPRGHEVVAAALDDFLRSHGLNR